MAAVASRYARALADVVSEAHLAPQDVSQQLADFMATWKGSADLQEVFLDPSFPAGQKVAILDRMNQKMGLAAQVRNFIAVLLEHGRMKAIEEILEEYRQEMNRRLGIAEVQVTSARALAAEERQALVARIAGLTVGQVEASFHEDHSLIGGVIVRIGSTVYDGSVRGRLERLQEQLAAE
jgi:F-type H+-transporting ATPase subunit delta